MVMIIPIKVISVFMLYIHYTPMYKYVYIVMLNDILCIPRNEFRITR